MDSPQPLTGVLRRAGATFTALVLALVLGVTGADPAQAAAPTPHPSLAMVSKTKLATGFGSYTPFSPGDMTGDGRSDMVAVDSLGQLWLYEATGPNTFRGRVLIGTRSWQIYGLIDGADMNGDGYADIIGVDAAGDMWLYLNQGDGTLDSRTKIGWGWSTIRDIAVVENGPNGNPAIYAIHGDDLRLYLTDGHGRTTSRSVIGAGGWGGISSIDAAGNVDAENGDDVLAIDQHGRLRLYSPNAAGTTLRSHYVGWSFSGWRIIGGFTIDDQFRVRAVDHGGAIYSWSIKHGVPSPTPPPVSPPEDHAVFVYGTLRVGERNHYRLKGDYSSMQNTSMAGLALYRMDGYNFPWAVKQSGYTVHGEVYWLKPSRWREAIADLDRLENYDPNKPPTNQSYVRETRTMANGFSAWVYVAGPRTAAWLKSSGTVIPSGDWLRR